MKDVITIPGRVDLCADNPMISLKSDPDGPFVTLASFFRVFHSKYGRGNILVLLQSPHDRASQSNACFADNEPLAKYVVEEYLSKFGAYKGLPSMTALQYRKLDKAEPSGDTLSEYRETISSEDTTIELIWSEIGEPFWFAYPPNMTATGQHHMLSLIHSAERGVVKVNGRVLPGSPIPREYAGHPVKSAILAFAENWIRPED